MFDNIQEQEQADFNIGRQTSLQQSFAASIQDWHGNEARMAKEREITRLLEDGRFVLVENFPAYCPDTDACMGNDRYLIADFATREEADKALEEHAKDRFECMAEVLPLAPVEDYYPQENIPF